MRLLRIRFSLLNLLAAITLFGVMLACIVNFGLSVPMVAIIWCVVFIALTVAPMLALVGAPSRRTFCSGFAWFGWMYIAICVLGMLAHSPNAFMPSSPIAFPHLAIENGMFVVYQWVVPRESWIINGMPKSFHEMSGGYDSYIRTPPPAGSTGGMGGPTPLTAPGAGVGGGMGGRLLWTVVPPQTRPIRVVPWTICRDIGHATLAIAWALLGGCFVVFLGRRNANRSQPNSDESSPPESSAH
jgi:hypothetical protein